MLIEQRLEQIKLSSSQRIVMDYLLEQREGIKDLTIIELARQSYSSTGTIVRLAKKLGFNGYEQLKEELLQEFHYVDSHFQDIDPNFPFNQDDNIQKIASKITTLGCETLQDTLSLIEHDSLQRCVQLIINSQTVHIAAISYSLLLAQIFKLDMERIGRHVNVCHISGEELFLPAIVRPNDCVILISYSGEIERLYTLAKHLKETGTKLIVISSLGDNHLKAYADIELHISTREKLHTKIKGYSNENSIKLILDIIYSCCFNNDYENNLAKRLKISKIGEVGRISSLEIMKDDQVSFMEDK